jgi:hypothetical protein
VRDERPFREAQSHGIEAMKLRSLLTFASRVALMLAALIATPEGTAVQRSGPAESAFVSVQPELLGVANSFSNAWGDYDNDGDLDLAVSLRQRRRPTGHASGGQP